VLLLWGCSMHLPSLVQLKRACVLMSSSFKAAAGNSLVDMYSKCGSIENTLREFNKMPSCDVIFWNDILGGCHAWTW